MKQYLKLLRGKRKKLVSGRERIRYYCAVEGRDIEMLFLKLIFVFTIFLAVLLTCLFLYRVPMTLFLQRIKL